MKHNKKEKKEEKKENYHKMPNGSSMKGKKHKGKSLMNMY